MTSTAPSPPTSSKSFHTVCLADRDKRNARTEQCKGSEQTPQTMTSALHQINNFYWFPRSLPLRQLTLPRNKQTCVSGQRCTASPYPSLGARCPRGISGTSICWVEQERNQSKEALCFSSSSECLVMARGLQQGWDDLELGCGHAAASTSLGEESGSSHSSLALGTNHP